MCAATCVCTQWIHWMDLWLVFCAYVHMCFLSVCLSVPPLSSPFPLLSSYCHHSPLFFLSPHPPSPLISLSPHLPLPSPPSPVCSICHIWYTQSDLAWCPHGSSRCPLHVYGANCWLQCHPHVLHFEEHPLEACRRAHG